MKKTQRVPIPVLFYLFYLRLTGFEFLIFVVALLTRKLLTRCLSKVSQKPIISAVNFVNFVLNIEKLI